MSEGVWEKALDTIAAGGPLAVVAAIVSVGMVGVVIAKQLPRLAPLVAAVRGHPGAAAAVEPPCRHDGDPDYDTPLEALRLIAAGSPVPVIGCDLDGRVRVFNAASERLLGYGYAELEGAKILVLMRAEDAMSHDRHLSRYLEEHSAGHRPRMLGVRRRVTLIGKDGRPVEVDLDVSHINNGWGGFWGWAKPAA